MWLVLYILLARLKKNWEKKWCYISKFKKKEKINVELEKLMLMMKTIKK
jgi:hypothetical protein